MFASNGPLSFWFLNHDLQEHELKWQLDELKQQGFRGVFIHPRDGLLIPYMSERWFEYVHVIMEHCEKIGLQAWLYDEDPYPSGTAGGKVLFDHPEYVSRSLMMRSEKVSGGRVRFNFPAGRLICVEGIEINTADGGLTRNRIDLTGHAGLIRADWNPAYLHHSTYYAPYHDFGQAHWRSSTSGPIFRLDCDLPEGEWLVCAFVEQPYKGGRWGSYADLLNPQAVQYFLKLTHEKYAQQIGRYFGKVIPGMFTDEPKAYGDVPWTAGFPEYFHSLFGYDLESRLADLFVTIDSETAQVRHDYRYALGKRFKESYLVPIRSWCEEQGIASTGHISPEEDPVHQTKAVPYLLSMLKEFHIPGTDLIADRTGSAQFPLLHLGPKLASSAARHTGRKEVLAEAFGANSWAYGFKEMRRALDWLFVMGVTEIVTHGQFYSIDGSRKKEAPPSLFYQSSHWPYFSALSEYAADVSGRLKEGVHQCSLLLYYPQASFSAYFPDRQADIDHLRHRFGELVHQLLSYQWDFDIVDEETLLQMKWSDGRLCGETEGYEMLLLPFCSYLESRVADCCLELTAAGFPVWLVGEEEPTIVRSQGDADAIAEAAETETAETAETAAGYETFWSNKTTSASILEQLENKLTREIELLGMEAEGPLSDVYIHQRKLDNGSVRIFAVNALDKWKQGIVRQGAGSGQSYAFALPPHGSFMVDIDQCGEFLDQTGTGRIADTSFGNRHEQSSGFLLLADLSHEWTVAPQDENVLLLNHWHLWDRDPRLERLPVTSAPAIDLCERHGTDASTPFWGFARFYTRGKPRKTTLVYEQSAWEGRCTIRVNGVEMSEAVPVRRFDACNFEIEITPYLQEDSHGCLNWIEVYFPDGGQMKEPFRLYGDFHVGLPHAAGFSPGQLDYGEMERHLHTLDSWDQLGFPHYSGTFTYEKRVEIPTEWLNDESAAGIYLVLDRVDDVASLICNGVQLGVRFEEPFVWNVASVLQAGTNLLSFDVANSPVNLLEGVCKRSGITGRVRMIKPVAD